MVQIETIEAIQLLILTLLYRFLNFNSFIIQIETF